MDIPLPSTPAMLDFLSGSLPAALIRNPASWMVLASLCVTSWVLLSEKRIGRFGGAGWMTLPRLALGAVFAPLTGLVGGIAAGLSGGIVTGLLVGLAYLAVQVVVCLILPAVLVDKL